MADRYDLAVIGAGPGGYVAAIRAAQLGGKVVCIDKGPVGGTCLNVGCIPSKTLLHWTEQYDVLNRHGAAHGFDASGVKVDWSKLQDTRKTVIKGLQQGIRGLFKKNKIEFLTGAAKFVTRHMVQIDGPKGKTTLEAERFLIATGSEPMPLPFLPFDEKKIVSSTGALSLPKIPKKMIVIGAGVIGVELASVYNRLGTKVTIVEMLDMIVPTMDHQISKQFQQILTSQGLTFHLGTQVTKGEVSKTGVNLMMTVDGNKQVLDADVVMVAIGRRPFTEGLGLDKIEVGVSEKGLVLVDDHFQTSVPNIYAIGDVIEGPMLAHKASEEGVVAVELMAGFSERTQSAVSS